MIKNKPMFERIRKSKTIKLIMAFTAINLLAQIAFPSVAMALTAGSASPEFASFEPVATTDMVNDFTGDFTYNLPVLSVPGPDGGGYSMSLSYHSGGSSEEEASWVGHGWTLNPGAINRQKRGYADDFNGNPVIKYNKQYPSWTHTTGFNVNMEFNSSDDESDTEGEDSEGGVSVKAFDFLNIPLVSPEDDDGSSDDESSIQPTVSFSKSIRYNNYSGFALTTGFGAGVKGMGSLSMNRTGGESTLGFTVDINPIMALAKAKNKLLKKRANELNKKWSESTTKSDKLTNKAYNAGIRADKSSQSKNGFARNSADKYSAWSFNAPSIPYSVAYNSGRSYNFSMSLGVEAFTIGLQVGLQGNMNFQANIPATTVKAFGYMHNPDKVSYYNPFVGEEYDDAKNIETGVENTIGFTESDYQIEKESTFDKHDKNLGIPFNNADVFTATGSGVVGGFKFYHEKIGHFYPTFVTNKQKIIQAGVEVAVGQTIAVGLDAGLGFQETKVQDWREIEEGSVYDNYDNSKVYMAFNGDMGGQVDYSGEGLIHATVGGGYMNRKLDLDQFNTHPTYPLNTTTNTELDTDNDRKTSRVKHLDKNSDGLLDCIEVTNKDGNVSVYGKPVYTKNELELTVGLTETLQNGSPLNQGYTVNHTAIAPLAEKTAVGQFSETPYASTFLLTENRTFDYVDVNGNGADDADFGGWTKFSYRDVHENYIYRAPYTGVIYNEGRMIDGNDQSGSYSTGQKQVKYLSTIETKTHIAFFVTNKTLITDFENDYSALNLNGSGEVRTDGLDASPYGAPNSKGTHHLEKLERIVLYAKNDLSKPISTTYFQYDYSLCKGIPNTLNAANGKLTLKKVWTESGGTIKSKIAPYQFEYNYHIYTETAITNKYTNINDGFNLLASIDQNPLYNEGLLDPWGSYCLDGANRFHNRQPWVDQKPQPATFDPAAWQLKQIKLPSGGEIHVQYEQKDYRYVQDKEAMGMVNLLAGGNLAKNGYKSGKYLTLTPPITTKPENRYYIDLAAIGVLNTDVTAYKAMLENYFVARKNKLYFKMLYSYTGATIPNLNEHRYDVDYITGYCAVNEVGIEGNQIYFELGELESDGKGKKDKTLPRYVGYQKFLTSAHRNLGWNARNVDIDDEVMLDKAYNNSGLTENEIRSKARDLLKDNTFNYFTDWTGGLVKNKSIQEVCENYNHTLSYFKIPLYNAKKGGGIRVKRLLSYDPGIETGDAMIYGSEYIYKNTDGLSSGVATNEPQTIREENALVGILERNKQSGWDKTFNGRDSKQYEGPLGESLMPGAQVVYERVIIKNIHSGRTTTGYAVNNYHTVKDFPMTVEFSELSKEGNDPTYKKYNLSLPLGMLNINHNKAWVTQGYLFKLNDMNGKPESQATYAGNYSPATFKEAAYTSKTTYSYTSPGSPVETLVYDPSTQDFTAGSLRLGQEEDLTMYRSRVRDVTNDFSLELDINFLIQWPPAVTLGFGLSYAYTQNELSQHVTSKVLRQKSLLISTTTTTDGVTQITKNIAFDKNTGDPVLTQTFDGYMDPNEKIHTEKTGTSTHDGHYYALNIPASWIYKEMGQKNADRVSTIDDNYSNQLTASVGNIVTYGEDIMSKFVNVSGVLKWNPNNDKLNKVVNSSATVYQKNWFSPSHPNATKLNAHYYPLRTYVYRDQVDNANGTDKIYGGGIIFSSFDFFNDWATANTANSTIGKWYSASEIKKYSENGYPIEEQDVLGIYSAAKFGYTSTLPILVAQNAQNNQVHFIDFELSNNDLDNDLMDDFSIYNLEAHSGRGSFNLSGEPQQVFVSGYNFDANTKARGVSIKLWLKSSLSNNPTSPNYNMKNPMPNLTALIDNQVYNFKRVAQTGNWSLYTADIKAFNSLADGVYDIQLGYNFMGIGEQVLIDDFRIQPLDAVMNCTVYNKDNKVSAQFDDQHFGVYYEYNNKEQLVRKSIETERGLKTLQEQQYNTPLIFRQ